MTPLLAHIGHAIDGTPITWVSFDWLPVIALTIASLLYIRAVRILRNRGRRIPVAQQLSWWLGLVCIAAALLTFIDPISDTSLVSMHMLQHLLIADIGGMLIMMGIRAPLCFFFWPTGIVRAVASSGWLPRLWQWLTQPQIALPLWLVTLWAWHVPVFYEAALTYESVHYLQHGAFVVTGMISWWPILNPTKRTVESGIWKPLYLAAERGFGTAVIFLFYVVAPFQIYEFYGDNARDFGLSPIQDQQLAGGLMMGVDMIIVLTGFVFFMLRSAIDAERENDRNRIAAQRNRRAVSAGDSSAARDDEQTDSDADTLRPEAPERVPPVVHG